MGYIVRQLIMAARSQDTESWMNIFFIVVLAIFWVLGGIAKARAKKTEEPDKVAPDTPAKAKPPGKRSQEGLFRQARRTRPVGAEPQRQTKIVHPRPVVQEPAVREKAVVQSVPERSFVHPMPSPAISEPLTKLPEIRQSAAGSLAEARPLAVTVPAESLQTGLGAESLLNPTDPDQLRRAILHYEILGKPLSLREPSG